MGKVFVEASEVQKNGRFIDARFNLQDKQWGRNVFRESHIEGAIHWDLEVELSEMSRKEGRHPMPSKEKLKVLFEKSGLSLDDTIYVYDQGGAPFASRAWYLLKYANFPKVYIENGGLEALKAEGFKVTSEVASFSPTVLDLTWNELIYANKEDVEQIVNGKVNATLLDARSAVRFRGEQEPIDVVAGHIPTAKNYDWEQLKEGNYLLPTEELLNKYDKDENLVVYCGSGVTAAALYSVLEDSGYEKLRLYVGSYSDWITDHDIEVGDSE